MEVMAVSRCWLPALNAMWMTVAPITKFQTEFARAFETSTPVIARNSCDEAIQTVSTAGFLDCFASLAMMLWTAPPERHQVPKRGRRSATKREAVHGEVYQS
ncbi:hypothetical protein, partial [Bradyrhizobium sp. 5.13L]